MEFLLFGISKGVFNAFGFAPTELLDYIFEDQTEQRIGATTAVAVDGRCAEFTFVAHIAYVCRTSTNPSPLSQPPTKSS